MDKWQKELKKPMELEEEKEDTQQGGVVYSKRGEQVANSPSTKVAN